MKIVSDKTVNGKRRVLVELDKNENIVAFRDDAFYRLGQPMDEVLPAHILVEAIPVSWCPLEQKWLD